MKHLRPPLSTKWVILVAVVVLLATGTLIGAAAIRHHRSPFSASIARSVSFAVYYPSSDWQTSNADATYANGVLQFTTKKAAVTLSFSEQNTPPVFTDVPAYYPSLLTKMNQYASFGTPNGTTYLTKPTELRGGQTAVFNNDGTLIFIRPTKDLSKDQWQQLFSNLRVLK